MPLSTVNLWQALAPQRPARRFFPVTATRGNVGRMLTEYLRLAMSRAHYKLLGGGEGFYGEIPGFQGVLAQGETLEACREELGSTLEDWLLFRISRHLPTIPNLHGADIGRELLSQVLRQAGIERSECERL